MTVIIKACNGGGGKGMYSLEWIGFSEAFNTAKSEAKISFNDDRVYIEKILNCLKILKYKFVR